MTAQTRTRVIEAVRLALRVQGVTAGELAERSGCSVKAAQRTLAALLSDAVLTAEVPSRKGKRRGDWRIVYTLAGAELRGRGRVEWPPERPRKAGER